MSYLIASIKLDLSVVGHVALCSVLSSLTIKLNKYARNKGANGDDATDLYPTLPYPTLHWHLKTLLLWLHSWLYNALTRGWLSNWNWKWNCCKNKKQKNERGRRGQIRFNCAASASTSRVQGRGLPALPHPILATLSARWCLLPVNTHVAFFITGHAHKCRTWRGCTVQARGVEREREGERDTLICDAAGKSTMEQADKRWA